jgi:hypothetical protein
MTLTHGTYACFLGTELIDGCDCEPCKAAYKARREAKKSFAYYRTNRPAKALVSVSAKERREARERANERMRTHRARKAA